MKTTWTGCCDAHPELAGVFGVGTRHEGGGFFMAHLNESDFVGALPEGLHDSVDAIPRQAENHVNSPIVYGINQNIGCSGFHYGIPLFIWTTGTADRQRFGRPG